LTWTRDNKPIMPSTRFTVIHEPTTGDIDVLFDFVKHVDTGLYKCKAENIYGSDETHSTLLIIDVPSIDERPQTGNPDRFKNLDAPVVAQMPDLDDSYDLQPPIVIIPLTDKLIREEVPVELSCKIIGNPKPKVSLLDCWFSLSLLLSLLSS
jgi:hypothetical protein